ncbi:MAG: FAD:protein FMN transferase [Burkholderiales bacterium]|nr:FAD:protein FMN transferase [Burkholderiales bacterium]
MTAWRSLRFDFTAMASPCEIAIDGRDERAMKRAADAAIAEVRRIESKFSRYLPQSMVSRINAAAGGGAVEVDEETASLLDFAAELFKLSDGLFDATSGVLRRAWDFRSARMPGEGELEALLPLVGWQQVERSARRVRLPKRSMELDFGGFGKEYAADRAAAVLLQQGVTHALVNLGGDIHVLGPRAPGGQPWQVDIERPRPGGADGSLATLPLARGGLATSGDYERFFEHEGQRYCHILDPRSGWPVRWWQSVTVLAANTTAAGALSTIAMLKPDGDQWLQRQGAAFLMVRADGIVLRQPPPTI